MKTLNAMYQQVQSIPELMEDIYWRIESDARLTVSTPDIFSTKQIYLFGCGDSYNAALGASLAFLRIAHMNVQPLTSMQASRYTADFLQRPEKNTLAVGISNSGEAARAVEAMTAFKNNGARTLALTGNKDSRMARQADAVLSIQTPAFVSAPGVRGYVASQLALYLLAIRFAEVRGTITMDAANSLRKGIFAYRTALCDALAEYAQVMETFALQCDKFGRMELLASGPCRAAADFGAAKAIEAVGVSAYAQDIEEFAHINFFLNAPERIPAVLIAPADGRSITRAAELAKLLSHQKRPYLIITSGDAFCTDPCAIRLKPGVPEDFFALFASVLAAATVSYMQGQPGNEYFRGHKDVYSEDGLPSIRSSELVLD